MDAGIYSAVSGSIVAQKRLDAIANNLAYSTTSGFKGERFVQEADTVGAAGSNPVSVDTPISRGRLETDFAQGPILQTGSPLDVAISGDGFLVVQTERGERLTRRGGLGLDADGFLVTNEGFRVQGERGDLEVAPNGPGGEVRIDPDGSISAAGLPIGKLRIGTVENLDGLSRDRGTLFNPGKQAITDVDGNAYTIAQGAVEGSNVSAVHALSNMIEAVRGFEAYMRAAERMDQSTGRAINDVGRV